MAVITALVVLALIVMIIGMFGNQFAVRHRHQEWFFWTWILAFLGIIVLLCTGALLKDADGPTLWILLGVTLVVFVVEVTILINVKHHRIARHQNLPQ